jgi:hypothetical protein
VIPLMGKRKKELYVPWIHNIWSLVQWLTSVTPVTQEVRDWEYHSAKPAQVQVGESPISTNKKQVVPTSHLSYMGGVNRRITVQAGPGIKWNPISKNNQCKKGWQSACLASVRPWVQHPSTALTQKKKKAQNSENTMNRGRGQSIFVNILFEQWMLFTQFGGTIYKTSTTPIHGTQLRGLVYAQKCRNSKQHVHIEPSVPEMLLGQHEKFSR